MNNREVAALLRLYPEITVCVEVDGVLREVERVRVVENARYFPPIEDAIFAVGRVLVIEALKDPT